jgi:signal transduction histidine kinase
MADSYQRTIREKAGQRKYSAALPFLEGIASPLLRLAARRLAAVFEDDAAQLKLLGSLTRCVDKGDGVFNELSEYKPEQCLDLLRQLRGEVLRGNPQEERSTVADLMALAQSFDRAQLWLESRTVQKHDDDGLPRMSLAVEIAHDLRSPLTSILFLSQTLRRGESGEINDLQHRQLGLIYAAALGVVSLASNLIELAHGEDRLLEQHPAPFSISEMLESICDMVRPLAEEKKLGLRALLPAVDCRLGFSAALSRVLLNLLNNALQNTDEGYVEIAVRSKSENVLEFSVRDTGTGLTEEAVQGLFEPFRRVRKGSRFGFSGSGLGLAICRRLLTAMGSELLFETGPDWGTRFYFDLELPPATV